MQIAAAWILKDVIWAIFAVASCALETLPVSGNQRLPRTVWLRSVTVSSRSL